MVCAAAMALLPLIPDLPSRVERAPHPKSPDVTSTRERQKPGCRCDGSTCTSEDTN
jgi:hypothetical protein